MLKVGLTPKSHTHTRPLLLAHAGAAGSPAWRGGAAGASQTHAMDPCLSITSQAHGVTAGDSPSGAKGQQGKGKEGSFSSTSVLIPYHLQAGSSPKSAGRTRSTASQSRPQSSVSQGPGPTPRLRSHTVGGGLGEGPLSERSRLSLAVASPSRARSAGRSRATSAHASKKEKGGR